MTNLDQRSQLFSGKRLIAGGCIAAMLVAAGIGYTRLSTPSKGHSDVSSQSRKNPQRYTTSPSEWASLTIEPVTVRAFRAEHVTEGKIAVDEDRSTPIFSP